MSSKVLVSYEDLSFTQRCIYQAFSSAESSKVTPKQMAMLVNNKGYDADDGIAVAILAKAYGFSKPMLCTGNFFNNEVAFTIGAEYIVVITDAKGAKRVAGLFKLYAECGADVGDDALTHPALNDVEWHAVYARSKGTTSKKMEWTDAQKVRPKGPYEGDCVVFYER